MKISVMAMAYSLLGISVFSQIINSWPNRKLLDYKYEDQLKDIFPEILLALFMGACVFSVSYLKLSDILTLLVQIGVGMIIYIGGSMIFKLESYIYLTSLIKGFLKKRKKSV